MAYLRVTGQEYCSLDTQQSLKLSPRGVLEFCPHFPIKSQEMIHFFMVILFVVCDAPLLSKFGILK